MVEQGSDESIATGLRIVGLVGRHVRAAADGRPEEMPGFKPRLLNLCSTGSTAKAKAATRSAGACCVVRRASILPVLKAADSVLPQPSRVHLLPAGVLVCRVAWRPLMVQP